MNLNVEPLQEILIPGEDIIFEQVFKAHFKSLFAYAFTILKDDVMAEEMVQNVFYKLWEKRDHTAIHASLKAYLYRSVHNESMNYLKHSRVIKNHQIHTMQQQKYEADINPAVQLVNKELEHHIRKALNELPEQCRTIFQMSRFEDLKYREIAEKMGLSVKTVENQMGKALHLLRGKLAGFIISLLVFFFTHKIV